MMDFKNMRYRGITAGRTLMVLVFTATGALDAQQFKRLPETISPDSAYVLAWGPVAEKGDRSELTEVPYEDETFDHANSENNVANYLVDTAARKIVATIPDFEFWRGATFHKNRADLEIAWSRDSRAALAIYDGRWGSEAVAWIEPRSGKAVNVQKKLEKGFYKVLHKHEPAFKTVDVRFSNAALVKPQLLVVHASGTIPKEQDTAEYVLKFKISGEGANIRFDLESARRLPEESVSQDEGDNETVLNAVYNRVRAKLSEKERETLRDEQTKWLKHRENMPDETSRDYYTQHRIAELRAMGE
jgi:hypothetical protein